MIVKLLKKLPIINKLVLFLWQKWHNGQKVKFCFSTHISYRCQFEGMNMVGIRSSFFGNMGYGSYIGPECNVSAEVGRFTSIGPRCTYINGTHAFKAPFVSTSPLFFSLDRAKNPQNQTFAKKQMFDEFRYYDKDKQYVNKIGNDCWIGSDVTFIGGVEIGDGAVVLAHAVVTKNIDPYAIVGGIPAKVIGYRYDTATIKFLMETKWWNNNVQWFEDNWKLLCDIELLKKYYLDNNIY